MHPAPVVTRGRSTTEVITPLVEVVLGAADALTDVRSERRGTEAEAPSRADLPLHVTAGTVVVRPRTNPLHVVAVGVVERYPTTVADRESRERDFNLAFFGS